MKAKARKWENGLGDVRWQPWLGSRLLYKRVNGERVWYVPPIPTERNDRGIQPVLYRWRGTAIRVAKREDRRIKRRLSWLRKLRLKEFKPTL